MKFLRRNFGYKVLSLTVAVLLYWVASGQQNPHILREFYVQPDISGLPAGLILKAPPQGNAVTVSGPAAAVEAFKAEDKKAIVDLTHAQPGTNQYPVQYNPPSGYGNVLDIVGPPLTAVTLERKINHSFYVDVDYDRNNAPAGYAYNDPRAVPNSVTVEGSASDVAKVQRVVATLNNTTTPGAISEDVSLVAQDVKLQPLDGVTITPKLAKVTLSLKRAPATKTIILSADLNGAPAPGYAISGYRFWPSTLTVSGPPDLLSSRSSLSVPIDVDGINAGVTRTVTVMPPAGLTIVGGRATVSLRLDVQAISPTHPASPLPSGGPAVPPTPPSGSSTAGNAPASGAH